MYSLFQNKGAVWPEYISFSMLTVDTLSQTVAESRRGWRCSNSSSTVCLTSCLSNTGWLQERPAKKERGESRQAGRVNIRLMVCSARTVRSVQSTACSLIGETMRFSLRSAQTFHSSYEAYITSESVVLQLAGSWLSLAAFPFNHRVARCASLAAKFTGVSPRCSYSCQPPSISLHPNSNRWQLKPAVKKPNLLTATAIFRNVTATQRGRLSVSSSSGGTG